MSREIKFRAWDMNKNTMSSWEQLTAYPENLEWLFEGSPAVPMQYTGLKDSTGKEIYEGDIVKCTNFTGGRTTGDKVVCWKEAVNAVGWNIGNAKVINREVIGNIYENPELLNG